jgi:hypothetical protein
MDCEQIAGKMIRLRRPPEVVELPRRRLGAVADPRLRGPQTFPL